MTSTNAECCASQPRSRYAPRGKTTLVLLAPLTLLAALAPKCPLCVAAHLTLLGLGTSFAAELAPWLTPLALALLAGAVVKLFWSRSPEA